MLGSDALLALLSAQRVGQGRSLLLLPVQHSLGDGYFFNPKTENSVFSTSNGLF